ncbi:phosphate ABC transporter permease [Candidatus Magnetomorum sp. HK-1]|nr:phosphate ABC transporter permease [Candidatus Magnetomorum sp. HK-1]
MSVQNKKISIREPSSGWVRINIYELWEYRELLFILAWRDMSVRYKQTLLGGLWAIIQPFVTMIIFSIVFGKLANIPSDNIPYPIFSYTALVPWAFFVNALNKSGLSLVSSSNLINKVYLPRLILPISAVIVGTLDFIIAFSVLLLMMFFYGIIPTLAVIWLPFFILLTLITSLGIGIWIATLNVKFYDLQNALPFILQAWMFATPIAYPSSLMNEPWRSLCGINPMSGVVEGFRWALLGTESAPGGIMIVSTITACIVLISGMFYFKRVEHTFPDYL